MTSLLLFDVDGTLVLTGGAGLRAMQAAFSEIFGLGDALKGLSMAGRTDFSIVVEVAARHGISPDAHTLDAFRETYLRHLAVEIDKPGPRKGVMPGIRALLDALEPSEAYLALLTGNYRHGAEVKLAHFDLWRYFPCGAFGDRAPERNRLLPQAIAEVRAQGGPDVPPERAVVIGDTPLDVACAQAGGARSIAVATGTHSVDQLRATGADVVFEDLADTAAVLEAIARLTV